MAAGTIFFPSDAPVWELSWSLDPLPRQEGIVIHNARYAGNLVLYKASLPIVRVEYIRFPLIEIGPFKYPLHENNLSGPMEIYERIVEDEDGEPIDEELRIRAWHDVGFHRVLEAWYFYRSGVIKVRFLSQWRFGRTKFHPYWRFDFDIDAAQNNQFREFNLGAGSSVISEEQARVWAPSQIGFRNWQVFNRASNRGYHFFRWRGEPANDFSRNDIWHLRYNGIEDQRGNQGNAHDDMLDYYLTKDPINGNDVVCWYAAHMLQDVYDYDQVGLNIYPIG